MLTRLLFRLAALVLVVAAAFYALLWWSFQPTPAAWTTAAPSPIPRFEGPAAVVGDRVFALGGFGSYQAEERLLVATAKVDVYDPATDRWTPFTELPAPITHINPVVDGNLIWIAGGFEGDNPGGTTASVWRIDIRTGEVTAGPPLPAPRGGGGLIRLGRWLHYAGGYYFSDSIPAATDHWALNLDEPVAWEPRAPLPVAVGHAGAIAADGRAWLIGGATSHHPVTEDTDQVLAYDPATDEWRFGTPLPAPRSHFEPGTFTFGGRIYIVGGRDNMSDRLSEAQMADISSYDPVAGTWAEHATLPHPLRAPIALVIGDRLLVANGSRWFAEAPQTTTWVAPCNETPGSPCARVATGTAEARAAVRNGLKALVTRLPTRLQGLLQLDRVILHAAGGRP